MAECRKIISGVDSDGDGMIDFEEFKVMMTTVASNKQKDSVFLIEKMPALNISTNVSLEGVDVSAIQSEFTAKLAKIIAGKTESDVMIVLRGSIPISLGGSQEPAAFGELVSIGGLSPEVNKNLSAAIAEILETKLCIPKSRIFLKFYDSKASHLKF
ncbi:hypothetical protein SADUNF_Sadunf16G0107000 [Salix dunnii]|uniref:EF-hand domain-containing protein n=1 Tax=Salix dunnii TaxID=1413687 RepID=A0A835MG71_9ROSI|nr:hypothetical protein SADUNF_Sadunf16G0107000 [Salix dunnii]